MKNYNNEAQSTSKQIASQSNLKFVQEYTTHLGITLKLKEIVAIVNVLNDYVECGYSTELGNRLEKIDEFITITKKDQK